MTETYKVLAQSVGTNVFEPIYTVGSGTSAVISNATLINTGANSSYSLAAVPSSDLASITTSVPATYQWLNGLSPIDGTIMLPGDYRGEVAELSSDGSTIAIAAPYGIGQTSFTTGYVYVYSLDFINNGISIKGSAISSEAQGDAFGRSLSLSANGDILAIGAPGNDGAAANAGHVRVYEYQYNIGDWVQRGADIDGISAGDNFGEAVSLSSNGNILAVGVRLADPNGENSGYVKVYEWVNDAWSQKGSTLNGVNTMELSGTSVSLSADGDVLVVGAPDPSSTSGGYVTVFEFINGDWSQKGPQLQGGQNGEAFGTSVDISADGNTIVAGSPNWDMPAGETILNIGRVRVYEWVNNEWAQKGQEINGAGFYSTAGLDVDISSDGDTIIFCSAGGYGTVEARHWSGSSWVSYGQPIVGSNSYRISQCSLAGNGLRMAVPFPGFYHFQAPDTTVVFNYQPATYVNVYSPENKHIIVNSKAIDAAVHQEFVGGMSLAAGDSLLFKCANEEVVINLSGVELS